MNAESERPAPQRMSSSVALGGDAVEEWQPRTEFMGRIPKVARGRSGSKLVEGDFPLDQVVITNLERLHPGITVHSATQYGASAWTLTARIETTLANGESKNFFLKYSDAERGKAMLEAEYNSMCELFKWAPNFVPEPYGWGQLDVPDPNTYYFLSAFIEMTNDSPDPEQLAAKLSELHQNSQSPDNKFGFHIDTCQGNLPQRTTPWQSSWVEFFVQLLRGAMELNTEINGDWKDLQQCVDQIIIDVVPQVLGPLESEGRFVKPCLIHGNLWDGNVGTDLETEELYCFDASVYYAHHEMEIAMWRGRFIKTLRAKAYINEYLGRMGVSEPTELFDDRHRLYSVYMTLHESACHNGSSFREECYENIKWLLEKYCASSTARAEAGT